LQWTLCAAALNAIGHNITLLAQYTNSDNLFGSRNWEQQEEVFDQEETMMRKTSSTAIGFLVLTFLSATATAQSFPTKPVRIITGSAGSSTDTVVRQLGPGMAAQLGQSVVIDNRTSGTTQGLALKNAQPDGYTTLVAGSTFLLFPLFQDAPYHPVNDFTGVAQIDVTPNVVAVHPSLPVKSIKELIAYAKARPGELNFSSAGVGGTGYVGTELFKARTGTNITFVPYKATAAAITGLISGDAHLHFNDYSVLGPHAKAGKVRLLAITSLKRDPQLPDLPTVAETVPGFDWAGVVLMYAPQQTPAAIVGRLNDSVVRYLRTPEAAQMAAKLQLTLAGGTPAEAQVKIKTIFEQTGKLVQEANLKPKPM
jgi:tripartite-type tricarboxylate transporter receptor subunit TctC